MKPRKTRRLSPLLRCNGMSDFCSHTRKYLAQKPDIDPWCIGSNPDRLAWLFCRDSHYCQGAFAVTGCRQCLIGVVASFRMFYTSKTTIIKKLSVKKINYFHTNILVSRHHREIIENKLKHNLLYIYTVPSVNLTFISINESLKLLSLFE